MTALGSTSLSSGAIALLDLPVNTTLSIDGHRLVLRRDDFIGFDQVVSVSGRFHFVTVRSAAATVPEDGKSPNHNALSLGLVIVPPADTLDWILVRRYDRRTEELSSGAPDMTTTDNLRFQINQGQIEHHRVVPYHRILSQTERNSWERQTLFLSHRLLERRNLRHGDKVVPGSYDGVDDAALVATEGTTSTRGLSSDGMSMVYPPIPIFDSDRAGKHTQHCGTKRYVSRLSPTDRTSLFLQKDPADTVLVQVLGCYYDDHWQDLLGDLQLAYILFLHLQCLASLEHWRDLIGMLSVVSGEAVSQYAELFAGLLDVLAAQLTTMENEFFEDMDFSENIFFGPAINRLFSLCSTVRNDGVVTGLESLAGILSTRFPALMESLTMHHESQYTTEQPHRLPDRSSGRCLPHAMSLDASDSDEDGPVIVAMEEVNDSHERNSTYVHGSRLSKGEHCIEVRTRFPILFASILDHEDVLMACARILDEAVDVSLVREAASYLEEVEAREPQDGG